MDTTFGASWNFFQVALWSFSATNDIADYEKEASYSIFLCPSSFPSKYVTRQFKIQDPLDSSGMLLDAKAIYTIDTWSWWIGWLVWRTNTMLYL